MAIKKVKIVIIGAGLHGQVVRNILGSDKKYSFAGFLDDAQTGRDILGQTRSIAEFCKSGFYFHIGIADVNLREKFFNLIKKQRGKLVNIIHPTACLEKSVKLGEGVFVGANAYININTSIGDNAVINNGCLIEHDNNIGQHCHLAPAVVIGGSVKIDEKVFIGLGSTIRNGIHIGAGTVVGMGSNVISDVESMSVYYGNPAKLIKKLSVKKQYL